MGVNTRSTDYGPSWADVGECLERFMRRWGGHWTLRVAPRFVIGQRGSMSVVCSRRRAGRKLGTEEEDYVGATYPSSSYNSLAGCMFQLLYDLDEKLEGRRAVAAQQSTF